MPFPDHCFNHRAERLRAQSRTHKHTNPAQSGEDYFSFTVEINETTPSLNLMRTPSLKTVTRTQCGTHAQTHAHTHTPGSLAATVLQETVCRRFYRLPLVTAGTEEVGSHPPPPI